MDGVNHEELAQCLFAEANDAFIIFDPADMRVLDVNPAACHLTGFDKQDLCSKKLCELFDTGESDSDQKLTKACSETRFFHSREGYRFRRADGPPLVVNVSVSRLHTESRTIGLMVVRDITERRRADEERRKLEANMKEAQKLQSLGVLAGGIAHDFNNLLTVILGNADLILAEISHPSPISESMRQIKEASIHAAEVCRQMLAYAGGGPIVVEKADLSSVVHNMRQLIDAALDDVHELVCDLQDDLPPIEADLGQVRQIVMNLMTNAAEAIGDRAGEIEIKTRLVEADRGVLERAYMAEELPEGRYVALEVTDSGDGMDEATRSRIFDPFFSTKFTGRGLGLAVVLGIIRSHHGTITVESSPGRGTTMHVLFPAVSKSSETASPKQPMEESSVAGGTLLIVDDEPAVLRATQFMLESGGFFVFTASTGREAIDLFKKNASDINAVLLDWSMPDINGEQTAKELRKLNPEVPIVLTSGFGEREAAQCVAEDHLNGFLQKPFTLEALVSIVDKVCRREK